MLMKHHEVGKSTPLHNFITHRELKSLSATRAEWPLDISATANMSGQINEVNIPDQATMGNVKILEFTKEWKYLNQDQD